MTLFNNAENLRLKDHGIIMVQIVPLTTLNTLVVLQTDLKTDTSDCKVDSKPIGS